MGEKDTRSPLMFFWSMYILWGYFAHLMKSSAKAKSKLTKGVLRIWMLKNIPSICTTFDNIWIRRGTYSIILELNQYLLVKFLPSLVSEVRPPVIVTKFPIRWFNFIKRLRDFLLKNVATESKQTQFGLATGRWRRVSSACLALLPGSS